MRREVGWDRDGRWWWHRCFGPASRLDGNPVVAAAPRREARRDPELDSPGSYHPFGRPLIEQRAQLFQLQLVLGMWSPDWSTDAGHCRRDTALPRGRGSRNMFCCAVGQGVRPRELPTAPRQRRPCRLRNRGSAGPGKLLRIYSQSPKRTSRS